MKKLICCVVLILAFFLSSCITIAKNPPVKKGKFPQIYIFDLDNDLKKEIITIEKSPDPEPKYTINIARRESKKLINDVTSLAVPGDFEDIDFSDLNEDSTLQMALYYKSKKGFTNLVIYKLKNDKIIKLYASGDCCDVYAEFASVLGRVKLNRPKCEGSQDCSCEHMPEWETWVWAGEKFIKEP